ncbi:META domain-containing protein [Roseibacterium sp. SDUM158016]|uniref:META domain-containing protein n=1 Tax=Roseicyclus sediminis TaxID=2980997 RepID=UPI0021D170BA|nr:META domain-containing protein [Roseibacterium sp. SDUM158016]MCU4653673.1 META domain-containing protein [Roseibacterium sp. SDUM158016]
MTRSPVFRTAVALAIAALVAPASAQDTRELGGTASYLARIALGPDAVLMVEARGVGGSDLGHLAQPTGGEQVPLSFALSVPEGLDVTLMVGIAERGEIAWLGDPLPVPAGNEDVALGEILLSPYTAIGFTSVFRCGDWVVETGFAGEDVIMDTGQGRVRLVPVAAASGAKFEAPGDPGTSFWNHGDNALVTLAGVQLPECRLTLPADRDAYTARGNEPFWSASVEDGRMRLVRLGFDDLDMAVSASNLTPEGDIVVEATDPAQALRAVLVRRQGLCHDDMSGMAYPEATELAMGDNVMRGCGGDPRDLFAGREWVVEDIEGMGVIDASRVTLLFDREGRVAGSGGCNRWFSSYELTGEGLSFGQAGSTMMACPDALMTQERRFFDALGRVIRHDFDETGALVLHAPEGAVIRARAE